MEQGIEMCGWEIKMENGVGEIKMEGGKMEVGVLGGGRVYGMMCKKGVKRKELLKSSKS